MHSPHADSLLCAARMMNNNIKAQLLRNGQLLLGDSALMQTARDKLAQIARTSTTVLLIGETGTGKELAARTIHMQSERAEKPFVAINCSAISFSLAESEFFGHVRGAFTGATAVRQGRFELADGGTLFLDEISAMPLELQPKLLRVIEEHRFSPVGSSHEKEVDVRLLASTNKDLGKAVARGEFREDLYHRVSVVPIYLPALRERRQDIPLLARQFLTDYSHNTKHFRDDAVELLSSFEWRGNVRELQNAIERLSIFIPHEEVTPYDINNLGIGVDLGVADQLQHSLRDYLRTNLNSSNILQHVERIVIELALQETGGNITRSAHLLGMDRSTLHRHLEKFHLHASDEENADPPDPEARKQF